VVEQEGSTSTSTNDLITAATKKPEHSGRTRGVGGYIPWKQGWKDRDKAPRKSRAAMPDIEAMKAQILSEVQAEWIPKIVSQMRAEMEGQMQFQMNRPMAEDVPSSGLRRSSVGSEPTLMDPLDFIKVCNANLLVKNL